ncbi:MAG: enoyl-CoA hydratase/isomerase family protein [Firmicutes bacterium]|nr:enoyl-CoA hydratase/isomerase family protein [Bacillota bacterium]MBR6700963.1 enoyl-CoA hydratase/isomerase family protein [Bacillota bacterium]
MENLVLYEKVGVIGVLKINRPKAFNALSREVVDLIDEKLEIIKADEEVRALIVTSDGNFAAGADIVAMVELGPEEARKFLFSETFNKLENLGIPTIAAICGYALGGGLELALTCDFRIASEDAKVGLPEITLGIMPGAGGTIRLPRLIGEAKAKEMIMLGGQIKADEALRVGLVSKVVPKEELFDEAMKLAEKLATRPKLALKAAKESINYGKAQAAAIDNEADIWSSLFATQDQKEGMRAFVDKRKPQYVGK